MTKFKNLTKKEQIEHIWEYYRWHILGTVLGLIFISQLFIAIFGPKPPKPIANIVVMGKYIDEEEKIASFKSEIENIIDSGQQGKVDINTFPVDWEQSSPLTMAMEQKLMLMIQAREIDVLIIEKEKFDSYMVNIETSPFQALDEIQQLGTILENNEANLIKHKFVQEDKEKVYGISVEGNTKLVELGLNKDFIISIPEMAPSKENATKVIEWMYK